MGLLKVADSKPTYQKTIIYKITSLLNTLTTKTRTLQFKAYSIEHDKKDRFHPVLRSNCVHGSRHYR